MSRLLSSALSLRRDPRMLKLPPYLSLLCILIGVAWLVLLPLDYYSRQTYISENALLPGQVHTYFGGSEQSIFRAYRRELDTFANKSNYEINHHLESILGAVGIKVGRQNYTYSSAGENYGGENLYGILQAPRGDATEAIVLVAAWNNIEGQFNRNGVALALTLARYFKRWSLWSKDIIILVAPNSRTGTQAWVDAYHDAHDSHNVASLPLKSGALQGAVAIDYPSDQRFDGVHIIYDGTNGQLPNLDLINSVINIAGGQMGMRTAIQGMHHHHDSYQDRLKTILRGMLRQGLGIGTGPHSSFIPYHVDAVTLQPYGEGWQDEMAMGRVIEGTFRSLNNLLEHLHQSFFFYLLMQRDRFVSIGTYLPSAMLLAANFTIMAIFLWVKSGQPTSHVPIAEAFPSQQSDLVKSGETQAKNVSPTIQPTERNLFLPLGIVATCHAASIIPLFVFNNIHAAPGYLGFTKGGQLRVERMGYVHTDRDLVHLVAGLAGSHD
ncbi:Glycosyl phosphatidyl inositol protein transamidase complex subunit [Conoideocrella luteorostrata]|uniref:Glycosyl phosphatidyl inositol protein transamidase complex subunit n=1 Tax=Conoideocrella luteorostrata TaxID=1105319 RepID=A0AAJ0CW99_9HYPO|nr:Glycosyl phosphatidyl inositol protein transamidase complex subunit [Conoideocrella luteorostrata]